MILGIGAQDEEAVVSGLRRRACRDRSRRPRWACRSRSAGGAGSGGTQNCRSAPYRRARVAPRRSPAARGAGVRLRLRVAQDVARGTDLDLLDKELGLARRPLNEQWRQRCFVLEHDPADDGAAALAVAANVFELVPPAPRSWPRRSCRGQQRRTPGRYESARAAGRPVDHRPAILPMSGRRSRSITSGMHFMGVAFGASTLSGAAARLFTLRWRPAWSSGWRRGCSIRRSPPGMTFGAQRVTISAPTELHQLLIEHGFRQRQSSLGNPTIVQEHHDEEPADTGTVTGGPTPAQHSVRFDKASRDG